MGLMGDVERLVGDSGFLRECVGTRRSSGNGLRKMQEEQEEAPVTFHKALFLRMMFDRSSEGNKTHPEVGYNNPAPVVESHTCPNWHLSWHFG